MKDVNIETLLNLFDKGKIDKNKAILAIRNINFKPVLSTRISILRIL